MFRTSSTMARRGSRGLSRSKDGGTKLYGASGKVKRPGLWELPMGTTIREILEEHAGGMREGVRFRGLLPGGASTDFLTEEHLDVAMDFTEVQKAGSRMGTGTMIVLDDQTCPVGMVWNLEHFFAQESCGWCTPCWSGLRLGGANSECDGRRARPSRATSRSWRSRRSFWRPATHFARLRRAQRNRCRAR